MGLFDRLRRRQRAKGEPKANTQDLEYLRNWSVQRRGVEAYLEPPTVVTETTLVLIAHDGEWTRRRAGNPAAAYRFARKLRVPCYEVAKVGYPQRMRDYQARQRIQRKRQRLRGLENGF